VNRRVTIKYWLRLVAGILIARSLTFAQSIPQDEASTAFALARQISDRDAGKTWGMPVCGPILFADSVTGDVVANAATMRPAPRTASR
jgi:hypothetical protein